MTRLFGFAAITVAILCASLATAQPPQKDAKGQPPKGMTGLVQNDPKAFQGYTFFSPLNSTKSFLIDMEGKVVRTWEGANTAGCHAYLLPNGNVIRATLVGPKKKDYATAVVGPPGGRIQEFTWEGELIWDYTCPMQLQQHHDFLRLPNGNTLMVVYDNKSDKQVADAGRRISAALQMDALIEVKQTGKTTGEIVWQWFQFDHLIQDHDKSKKNYGDVAAHPELVDFNFGGKGKDWTHVNAISYNPELDQIMLSINVFGEIWIIDHSTTKAEAAGHTGGKSGKGGDILYRWGNPQVYRAGNAKNQQLFKAHNAHWIPKGLPGAGNLLIFNNGSGRPGGDHSSVDEIVLPVDAQGRYTLTPGMAYGPEKPVWSYSAPNKKDFYSFYISGAQRLSNGNTLICSGASGTFFEVTPQKDIVWKYVNPFTAGGKGVPGGGMGGGGGGGGPVFRVLRYAPDYPALAGKDLTPTKLNEFPKKDGK